MYQKERKARNGSRAINVPTNFNQAKQYNSENVRHVYHIQYNGNCINVPTIELEMKCTAENNSNEIREAQDLQHSVFFPFSN